MEPRGSARTGGDAMTDVATIDVTVAAIDDMEPIYDGLARRARATLGVSSWGMQVFTLPPNWDGYPDHNHDTTAFDPNQEEVYVPLSGPATPRGRRPGVRARAGHDGQGRPAAAPTDPPRSRRSPVPRAGRQAGRVRGSALDGARSAAADGEVASRHGAADGGLGRRRAGVRAAD